MLLKIFKHRIYIDDDDDDNNNNNNNNNNINSPLDATITNFIENYNQLNMLRPIILPILRSTRLCLPQAVNTV